MDKNTPVTWPGWNTVKVIGRGGFGTVYEIQRELPNRIERAALKVIDIPESDEEIRELYAEGYDTGSIKSHIKRHVEDIVGEYSLMLDLKGHTNIVYCDDLQYYPFEHDIGWRILIKMELLTPLKDCVGHIYDEAQVIKVGQDICKALSICKEKKIIHRDIKPENIFVSDSGDYKLGDFGVARVAEKTASGTKIGTYEYMAPEIYNNNPQSFRSDLYSLGLVLYWLMNERRTPFLPLPPEIPTATEKSVAYKKRFDAIPIPMPKNGSEWLKQVVMRSCSFNPAERFNTPTAMLHALSTQATTVPKPQQNLNLQTELIIQDKKNVSAKEYTLNIGEVQRRITLPSQIESGKTYRYKGLGLADHSSNLRGDLYVRIIIEPKQQSWYAEFIANNQKLLIPISACVLMITVFLIAILLFNGTRDEPANSSAENNAVTVEHTQCVVPKLDNLRKEEAMSVLSTAGIQNYDFQYEYSETVPEGVVCRQSIVDGMQLPDADTLIVFVSKGSEYITVPDVTKKTKSEAEQIINALQLNVEYQYEQSNEVEKDQVIRQSIPSGSQVKIGSTIILDVCKDRLIVQVPNVVGQSKASANASLTRQDFKVIFSEEYHDTVSEGYVISQNPSANSQQERGTAVTIVLSKGPKPVETIPATTEPAQINITVSFDPVGGYVGTSSKTVTVSSRYGSLPTPSKDTYSFDGWYTSATGGAYVDSNTVVSSASSHTLYAHWSSNRYSDWVSELPSDVQNNRSSYLIEERVEYQSRVRNTTTSYSSDLAGWTRISSDLTGWTDWSSWQNSPITASDSREVNTQTIAATTKTIYCYERWYGRNSPNDYYYSSYGNGVWKNHETYECDSPLPKDHVTDGYQCYKGPGGSINNPYWWNETTKTVEVSPAYTQYQYRDAIYTYTFEQWSNWSSWQTSPIYNDRNTQVQTRTLYRYVRK